MFGWLSVASSCASRVNRARRSGSSAEELRQHLQGDVAIQLRVARAVHLAHGARSKRGDDFVGTDSLSGGEHGVRHGGLHRGRWGRERIGKHGLAGDRQSIEEAGIRGVRRQQRLDFTTQPIVVSGHRGQKGVALVGRPFHSFLKQRLHARPAFVRHGRASEPSSRLSHAFAVRQSRLAVDGDTLSTCAASSIVSPPNARSSTILASSASTFSRRSSASIQRQDGDLVRCGGDVSRFVDRHASHAVAPLARVVTTGVIDEDPAHDLRRDTEEMRAILPIDLTLVDEPDVHLMDESRGLQGVIGPFVPELAHRHAAELRIDERQQLIERSPVAATPIAEQRGDVARRDHWSLFNQLDRSSSA